jgi:hypothetical protein
MSRQLNVGGDHLSQHEIKSQPLDVIKTCLIKSPLSDLDLEEKI